MDSNQIKKEDFATPATNEDSPMSENNADKECLLTTDLIDLAASEVLREPAPSEAARWRNHLAQCSTCGHRFKMQLRAQEQLKNEPRSEVRV